MTTVDYLCPILNQTNTTLKNPILPILISLFLLICGCSDPEEFTVEGQIKGVGAQNITMTYFADGGLKSTTVAAADGRFSLVGSASAPTLVIISVAPDNVRIATAIARNGEKITVNADIKDPYATQVNGNYDSEAMARWINANATTLKSLNASAINKAVGEYVSAHKDKLHATAILSGFFCCEGFESTADSLFTLLTPDARPVEVAQGFNIVVNTNLTADRIMPIPYLTLYERCDSLIHINPTRHSTTLLCFIDADKRSRDSIAPQLKLLTDSFPRKRLMAVEISTAPDSAAWRTSLGRDSVDWPQTWVQGSVSAVPIRRLAINRIPYFIVADSTGVPIYRGPSISRARKTVESRLKQ